VSRRSILLATAALAIPAIAHAQHAPTSEAEDRYHYEQGSDIVITAPITRTTADILSGTTVVTGAELTRTLKPTLGETLARQPGVSSTSFGPNASRPVLRGFQGERIRVLTDGIGSFDVSNTSVDHAVTINPLTADRIEVLRGPAALLFGSSAVGGVVNVIDSRIPRRLPDEAIHLDAIGTYGSAADERSVGGAVDVPVAGKIVLHLDGSYAKSDDLRTGGYILSPALRAIAAQSDEAEIRENAELRGDLENSAGETWDVAGGASIVIGDSHLGFSLAHYRSNYGIPPRLEFAEEDHGGEEEEGHGHEDVRLDLRQTRGDIRGDIATGGGLLQRIRVRAGFADYRHDEIEPSGEIGTSFFNQGYEGRLELVQTKRGNWDGVVGGQFLLRNLNVVGEEKFVPKSETQQYGVFTLQSLNLGAVRAEAGLRYEHSVLKAAADADLGNPDFDRTFDALSGSLGASLALGEGWRIGINGSRSERAPAAEELFANGPHAGTQAFEIGNPDFVKEKSWGLEGTLRGSGNGYNVSASVFHNWIDDYIYEAQTGEEIDELPVYRYAQADARYWGFEVEGSARLAQIGSTAINVDALADYVRATITEDGPAPRIPPLRLLGGVEAQAERFTVRGEVEHAFEQDRIADFETSTDAYTLVNASVAFQPFGTGNRTSLVLSANNIFDVEARRHASFLKDFAPLAGRDIRLTLRASL
jgi:iron complex outermembrane receptor protein